jgi:VWFA-related protein
LTLAIALTSLVSFLAGLPDATLAQEKQDLFTDTLEVQAVDVEVAVTDRRGNPVPGLKASDFRLVVDGKPVPIEFFAEIREGDTVAAAPDTGALPAPPSLQQGEEVGNNYLVFIDEFFTPPAMRNEALKALAREVDALRPQDRMAIVAYDTRKLTVLAPWMSPGEPLRQFLLKLGDHKSGFAATPFSISELEPSAHRLLNVYSDMMDDRGLMERATGDRGNGASGYTTKSMEALQAQFIERTIGATVEAMRAFAPVSGRKLLVLLSGGWNYDVEIKKKTLDQKERLRPLIDACSSLGYTVYPIHLAQEAGVNLPRSGTVAGGAGTGIGTGTSFIGSASQNSLIITAEETGGKMLLPGSNRHLSRIAADTRSYYWLGFTHSGGGERQGLKVETVRKDLEVRSRSTFVPLSRQERSEIGLRRALLTHDTAGMKPLQVSAEELRPLEDGVGELAVTVRIPADQLELLQQGGQYRGKLELRIAALDDQGQRSEVPVLSIDIARPEAPKPGSVIRYDTRLRVRYAPQDIQFVVSDLVSGKSFAERIRVAPKN